MSLNEDLILVELVELGNEMKAERPPKVRSFVFADSDRTASEI